MGAIFNLQTEMFVKVARGWLRSDLAKWGIFPYHWFRPMRRTEVSEALRRRASEHATITPPLLQGGEAQEAPAHLLPTPEEPLIGGEGRRTGP
jgi:hypothetical protein